MSDLRSAQSGQAPAPQKGSDSVRLMRLGALWSGMAVLMGAFGTHVLRGRLSPDQIETIRTAVQYQAWHGIAVVAIAGGMSHFDKLRLARACRWLLTGSVLFSGSLYILVITGWGAAAFLTPIGGVAMLIGWAFVAAGARKLPRAGDASKQSP